MPRAGAAVPAWGRPVLAVLAALVVLVPLPAPGHFVAGCKGERCKRHVVRPFRAHLNRIAMCESTRRWHLNGMFDGGLQFHPSTWASTGSRYAFAYLAPPSEQRYRAVVWASRIGWAWHSTAGWPVCG